MQHRIEYDSVARILIGTLSGKSRVEGHSDFYDALDEHPDLPRCIGIISDGRSLDASDLTSSDVRSLLSHAVTHNEKWRGKARVFVAGRALEFGLGRMVQMLGEEDFSFPIHVCYTLEEARAWIVSQET